MSVAILGGGAFGTALAVAVGAERPVTLWARDGQMLRTRQSPRLPGVTLPKGVTITGDLETALTAQTLLFAMPMQSLVPFSSGIAQDLSGKALVACCKGIDLSTLRGPTAILASHFPGATPAILTGPSFAIDIAAGLPTALTLACADDTLGQALQAELSTASLRLYRSTDVIGAELGGALKNVIAIACGACIGQGMGDSARAALMTRGFSEMQRLSVRLGAKAETLGGLSGLGDLVLTCTSDKSRNFCFGRSLGRGEPHIPSVTVEGLATASAALRLGAEHGVDMPITAALVSVFDHGTTVRDAIQSLLSRPLKQE
jgi:glycerol-3-phosphate dehydrogenase (NAD(P)+)